MTDAPIDLRTNPQPVSNLPIGTLVTGYNGSPTIWRVTAKGVLKKERQP